MIKGPRSNTTHGRPGGHHCMDTRPGNQFERDAMNNSTDPTDKDQQAKETQAPEPDEEGYEVDAAGTFKG